MTDVATTRDMKINHSAAALQAAIEGHVVALARRVMAGDDLAVPGLATQGSSSVATKSASIVPREQLVLADRA